MKKGKNLVKPTNRSSLDSRNFWFGLLPGYTAKRKIFRHTVPANLPLRPTIRGCLFPPCSQKIHIIACCFISKHNGGRFSLKNRKKCALLSVFGATTGLATAIVVCSQGRIGALATWGSGALSLIHYRRFSREK